jgi:predicted site-specific integrase-resolvase
MSRAEAADALGVSVSILAEWHRRGQGPHAIAVGGTLRYRPNEIADWLRDQIQRINGVAEA